MRAPSTARSIAGLVLPALLWGCHDWVATADGGDDTVDAAEDQGLGDVPPDRPPDVPPDDAGGDDALDLPLDDGGTDVEPDADGTPDLPDDTSEDAGPEEASAVCGNGILEPGEDCEVAYVVECTTTCGTRSTVACPADCRVPPPDGCPPAAEVCNGLDDDCNGLPDDGRTTCPGCAVATYGTHVYHFCSTVTWDAARTACAANGLHLVRIDDEAENTWLASTGLTRGPGPWWIGYNDLAVEGDWVWDGPDPTTSYTNWGDGEPNDYDLGEDCGELGFSGNLWNDNACTSLRVYICEYP